MPRIAFEDLTPGTTRILGSVTVSKEDILAFAREYDAQPFHVDEIAARDSFIGTLIAYYSSMFAVSKVMSFIKKKSGVS